MTCIDPLDQLQCTRCWTASQLTPWKPPLSRRKETRISSGFRALPTFRLRLDPGNVRDLSRGTSLLLAKILLSSCRSSNHSKIFTPFVSSLDGCLFPSKISGISLDNHSIELLQNISKENNLSVPLRPITLWPVVGDYRGCGGTAPASSEQEVSARPGSKTSVMPRPQSCLGLHLATTRQHDLFFVLCNIRVTFDHSHPPTNTWNIYRMVEETRHFGHSNRLFLMGLNNEENKCHFFSSYFPSLNATNG